MAEDTNAVDNMPSAKSSATTNKMKSKSTSKTATKAAEKTEFAVSAILAHSFHPAGDGVPRTHDEPKLLVAWEGVDPATGAAWEPTWLDMVDVGVPYISYFFHHLERANAKQMIEESDGRTYVYADGDATAHRVVPHEDDDGFKIEHRPLKKAQGKKRQRVDMDEEE